MRPTRRPRASRAHASRLEKVCRAPPRLRAFNVSVKRVSTGVSLPQTRPRSPRIASANPRAASADHHAILSHAWSPARASNEPAASCRLRAGFNFAAVGGSSVAPTAPVAFRRPGGLFGMSPALRLDPDASRVRGVGTLGALRRVKRQVIARARSRRMHPALALAGLAAARALWQLVAARVPARATQSSTRVPNRDR
jgi:hypothetical protein